MTTNFDPQYSVKVIRGVRVPMRDGVELNIKIIRPDAPGRFPAIMGYTPYRMGSMMVDDWRDEIPSLVPYLAERGYVIVVFDVRGTGSSAGFSTDMYSDAERQDGYDMIEWIAAQDWCTGAVGMYGISYGACVQWQVAVQQPPHLKALIVRSGNNNVYTDFTNPGGSFRPWMFEAFAPHMNASNFAPPEALLTGAKFSDIWAERLEKSEPWSLNYLRYSVDGPYWQKCSLATDFSRVKCPVFLVEGWADWYYSVELRAFQQVNVPKKVLIGPWGHYHPDGAFPGPRIHGRREYLRWYDHWLKGIDTGIMDEPPVTVFMRKWKNPELVYLRDEGTWRNETAWPPQHVKATVFYLADQSALTTHSAPEKSGETYDYRPSVGLTTGRRGGLGSTTPFGFPLDQRLDEAYSLVYTTPPLAKPMELLGEPTAVLFVSSTAKTAYFHVKVCDVAPDGTSKLITDGGLLATHHKSHIHPEPLVPGQIYELRFTLQHLAYSLDAGHRLRISVTSAHFQNAWPTPEPARNTLHHGPGQASHVLLPVSQGNSAPLEGPKFEDSLIPLPSLASLPKPEYKLHMDLVQETVTSELTQAGYARDGLNSKYTVSNRNPARAQIDSHMSMNPSHPTLDIRVEAGCQTISDENSYSHLSEVEITVNGKRYFQKSWSISVPRNGS